MGIPEVEFMTMTGVDMDDDDDELVLADEIKDGFSVEKTSSKGWTVEVFPPACKCFTKQYFFASGLWIPVVVVVVVVVVGGVVVSSFGVLESSAVTVVVVGVVGR